MWNTKIGRRTFAASLTIESAISFPGIPEWEGIQKREMNMSLAALRMAFDVINYVIALIISIVADGVEDALGVAENGYAIMLRISSKIVW